MQAILYARFSSDAQSLGDSIDRQIRTCTPFIDAKGWTLEAIVRDGHTANAVYLTDDTAPQEDRDE